MVRGLGIIFQIIFLLVHCGCSKKSLQVVHEGVDGNTSPSTEPELPSLVFEINGVETSVGEYQLQKGDDVAVSWNGSGFSSCLLMPFGQSLLSGEIRVIADEVIKDIILKLSCQAGTLVQDIQLILKVPPEQAPGCETESEYVGDDTNTSSVRSPLNEVLGISPVFASSSVPVAFDETTAKQVCVALGYEDVDGMEGYDFQNGSNLFASDGGQFRHLPASNYGNRALVGLNCVREVCPE